MFKDAHHPLEGKASLIYLKRHGELKLRFQHPDNSWHEIASMLGPMISSREPFTHAAFTSNNGNALLLSSPESKHTDLLDNTMLLAAYDVSSRVHLYRIEVKWAAPPQQKQGQPTKPWEKPSLQVAGVSVEDNCFPTSSTTGSNDISGAPESKLRIPAQLTHFSFLPTTPDANDGTLPTIQAIFSTPPNNVSFEQPQPQQNPCSIIVKWEVHHTQRNQLHSSLDKVTSKKKSVSSVPTRDAFLLKRVQDTLMHSVVLSFFPLWYNMILSFVYSDGTIELRKRSTMDVLVPDYNTDTVTSLAQAGFTFPTLEPSLHVSLSPNYCIAACMQQDGSVKLRSVEYSYGSLNDENDEARHTAALAALVLQSSSAANQYFSSDDLFAVMGELSEKRTQDFIHLMFQGLSVNIDCGVDDNSQQHLMLLGRSPVFGKTLSAAHLLGLQGTVQRTVGSKISWIILNIKYITQIITTIARMHGSIEKTPLRPEVVPQFIGICRWIMHFMVYMIDELMALGFQLKDLPASQLDRPTLEAKIKELNKPAIIILLSSFSRMMMKLWANPLAWVLRTAFQYTNSSPTPDLRRVYTPLHQTLGELPFDWRHFDHLVTEAHMLVRSSYKRANLDEAARNEVERQLVLGHIPEVLMPAARRLLGDTLFNENQQNGALLDKVDVARIMFFDTTFLGFQDSNQAKEYFETHVVDVCQKVVIRGTGAQTHPLAAPASSNSNSNPRQRSDSVSSKIGASSADATGADGKKRKQQLRQCVRCGACMEDVVQGMPGYANHHVSWLMGVAKHCICGSGWVVAPASASKVAGVKRART